MKTITKNCENCSNPFQASAREINRGNGRFCSLKCSSTHHSRIRKEAKELNCTCSLPECGTAFYRNNSKMKNAKSSGLQFCSRKCKDIAQRIEGLSDIQPHHYGIGNSVRRYRALALRTYPNKCIDCEYDKFVDVLEVHHLNGNRNISNVDNLVIVCPTCHVERHAGHRPNTNYNGIECDFESKQLLS